MARRGRVEDDKGANIPHHCAMDDVLDRRRGGAALLITIALLAFLAPAAPSARAEQPARGVMFAGRLEAAAARLCGRPLVEPSAAPVGARRYAPAAAHPLAPWMAKLEIAEAERAPAAAPTAANLAAVANCGAAALTRDWLITAAHCVAAAPWLAIEATLGAEDLSDPRALKRNASVALCPTAYQGDGFGPDVALVRLATPLPPDFPSLRVATEAEMRRLVIGGRALAAGWPQRDGAQPRRLNAPVLRLAPPDGEPAGVLVTAPSEAQATLCVGESGAPLVAELGYGPALIGVFSSVDALIDPATGEVREICDGAEARGYFTAMSGLQHWIADAIRACDADLEACLRP